MASPSQLPSLTHASPFLHVPQPLCCTFTSLSFFWRTLLLQIKASTFKAYCLSELHWAHSALLHTPMWYSGSHWQTPEKQLPRRHCLSFLDFSIFLGCCLPFSRLESSWLCLPAVPAFHAGFMQKKTFIVLLRLAAQLNCPLLPAAGAPSEPLAHALTLAAAAAPTTHSYTCLMLKAQQHHWPSLHKTALLCCTHNLHLEPAGSFLLPCVSVTFSRCTTYEPSAAFSTETAHGSAVVALKTTLQMFAAKLLPPTHFSASGWLPHCSPIPHYRLHALTWLLTQLLAHQMQHQTLPPLLVVCTFCFCHFYYFLYHSSTL